MAANSHTKYNEDFRKSLVSLHQNGKTQARLCREYGVSQSAPGKWARQYSTVEITNRKTCHSLREPQLSVSEYIEGYYNSRRPHGTPGMLTPNEAEDFYREQTVYQLISPCSLQFFQKKGFCQPNQICQVSWFCQTAAQFSVQPVIPFPDIISSVYASGERVLGRFFLL